MGLGHTHLCGQEGWTLGLVTLPEPPDGMGRQVIESEDAGHMQRRSSVGAERKPLGPEEGRPGLGMTLFQPRETVCRGRKAVVQAVRSMRQGQEGRGDACPLSGEQGTRPGSGGMGTGPLRSRLCR